MTFELILAGLNQRTVVLDRKTTKGLQTYKKNVIRFIYDCNTPSQCGAILNFDQAMNHEHACAVAIHALYKKRMSNLASVILCTESHYLHWFYFMMKHSGLEVFKLTDNNVERLLMRNQAIILIVSEKDHTVLRSYAKDYVFFVLIVDEVDVLCDKLLTKQIQADFHLGITYHNFISAPDQQLRWKIINWALKKTNKQFVKLTDFIQYDDAYVQIRVDPYTSFWYTVTWDLCSPSDIAKHEMDTYSIQENVKRCAEVHGLQMTPTNKKVQRKRESAAIITKNTQTKKRTMNLRKRNLCLLNDTLEHWSSDEERPDLSVFEVSTKSSSTSNCKTPITLRLKSPKKKPANEFNSSFVEYDPHEIKKGRRIDFESSFSRGIGGSVSVPSPMELRKTKSSHAVLFDQMLLHEFSQPFDVDVRSSLQTARSDSALMDPSKCAQSDTIAELDDEDVLREFSRTFAPSVTEARSVSPRLLASEIRLRSASRSAMGNSSSPLSQHDIPKELNLCPSGSDIKFESGAQAAPHKNDEHTISSDDDLDNCMQFLRNSIRDKQVGPTAGNSSVKSCSQSDRVIESPKDCCAQRMLWNDLDTESFLRALINSRSCT